MDWGASRLVGRLTEDKEYDVPDQPTDETPQQAVERELRAAQEEVRQVGDVLRAALAEDDRLAAEADEAGR
ncbi:hypothetical protein [Kribbella sp. NPDC050470]|uniref:hypothetical protein n=1 Tax=unclassified Kribbella TaxID=2644121 RepID=UPI0037BAFDE0